MLQLISPEGFPRDVPAFGEAPVLAFSGSPTEISAPAASSSVVVRMDVIRVGRLSTVLAAEQLVQSNGTRSLLEASLLAPQLEAVSRGSASASSAASVLLRLGRADDARQLLQDSPRSDYWSKHYYAVSLFVTGAQTEALESLEAIAKERPTDPRPVHALGQFLICQQRWDAALEALLCASEMRDASASVFSDLGLAYIQTEKHREAVHSLRLALRRDSRSALALTNLGVCYKLQNNTKRAKRYFREALASDSLCTPATLNLVECLLTDGALEEAAEMLEGHDRLHPGDSEVRERLAWTYLQMNRPRKARAILIEMVEQHSTPPTGMLNNLALTFVSLGETKEASKTFEQAINDAVKRQDYAIDVRCNYAHFLKSHYEWDRILVVLPANIACLNVPATLLLAPALMRLGQHQQAAALLRNALANHPGNPNLLVDLSYVLASPLNRPGEAEELLSGFESLVAQNVGLANNLAYALIKRGKLLQAQSLLQPHLAKMGNERGDLWIYLMATWGLLQIRSGNYSEGLDWYRQAKSCSRGMLERRFEQKIAVEEGRHLLVLGRSARAMKKLQDAQQGPDQDFAAEAKELIDGALLN